MPAAIEKEHIASLRSAVRAWLATDSDLVTLAAYNASSNISIINALGDDELKAKSVNIILTGNTRIFEDVDGGPYEATFQVLCRHESEVSVLSMLGAVEALAEQDRDSNKDAAYNTHAQVNLFSIVFIPFQGDIDNPVVRESRTKGVKEAQCGLRVRWREK